MAYRNQRLGSDSFPGRLNEAKSFTTANGGTALGTTVTVSSVLALPNKTSHVTLYPQNFAGGATVFKFALNPFLLILVTGNNLQTATDFSQVGQNFPADATGVKINALDTLANGGSIYIGSHVPFRGVAVTNGNPNANASTLSVNFWNGTAWTAVAGFSDGTAAAGATMAQNGLVTWTVPTTWAKAVLSDTINPDPTGGQISGWGNVPGQSQPVIPVSPLQKATLLPYNGKSRYWTQWVVSAKLSATVNNTLMLALNRVTTYAETVTNVFTQFRTFHGEDGVAAIEAIINAGTGNVIGTAYTDNEFGSF